MYVYLKIDWNGLIKKLEICWELTKNINKNITDNDEDEYLEVGLTAANLNKVCNNLNNIYILISSIYR